MVNRLSGGQGNAGKRPERRQDDRSMGAVPSVRPFAFILWFLKRKIPGGWGQRPQY